MTASTTGAAGIAHTDSVHYLQCLLSIWSIQAEPLAGETLTFGFELRVPPELKAEGDVDQDVVDANDLLEPHLVGHDCAGEVANVSQQPVSEKGGR